MNVELINKVIEAINRAPAKFRMRQWVQGGTDLNVCGTAACIAGWAAAEAGYRFASEGVTDAGLSISLAAEQALQIDPQQSWDLFHMWGVDGIDGEYLRERFDKDAFAYQRAEAATRVLEHLRDTGEVDWARALRNTGLEHIIDDAREAYRQDYEDDEDSHDDEF